MGYPLAPFRQGTLDSFEFNMKDSERIPQTIRDPIFFHHLFELFLLGPEVQEPKRFFRELHLRVA